MKNLIKSLYESEINVTISWFWDGGFEIKIGDEMNGFKSTFTTNDLSVLEQHLEMKAKELYPESKFAKEYKGDTFESASEVMMKYLCDNHHPHTKVDIQHNMAQLWEGQKVHHTDKYLKD